jgi:hypothetical protein
MNSNLGRPGVHLTEPFSNQVFFPGLTGSPNDCLVELTATPVALKAIPVEYRREIEAGVIIVTGVVSIRGFYWL